ncbi:MAG: cobalamin-dependent protein, partial [Eubacterium sp.]
LSLKDTLKSEKKAGLMVIGTIEGDVHDIGKSIFKNAAAMSGFEVIDLGVDVVPEVFISAIEKHRPDIVGISIVMTEAIKNAKMTVEKIRREIGKDLKIIIGGVATNMEIAKYIGADAYSNNVLNGVNICLRMVNGDEKKY